MIGPPSVPRPSVPLVCDWPARLRWHVRDAPPRTMYSRPVCIRRRPGAARGPPIPISYEYDDNYSSLNYDY